MEPFFPFIHEKKKEKEFIQEYLYIEEYLPTAEEIKRHQEKKETEITIIEIDMI